MSTHLKGVLPAEENEKRSLEKGEGKCTVPGTAGTSAAIRAVMSAPNGWSARYRIPFMIRVGEVRVGEVRFGEVRFGAVRFKLEMKWTKVGL